MLTYWTIYFRNTESIVNTIDNARIWHGIFFNILKDFDEEIAKKYHDNGKKQSFSISPILSADNRSYNVYKRNQMLKVNISLLTDEISEGFFDFLKINNEVKFAKGRLIIKEIKCKAVTEEILEKEKFSKGSMNFKTPTTFKAMSIHYPLPVPKKIFKSLNDSYKNIFGSGIDNPEIIVKLDTSIIIEGLNINTEVARFKEFSMTGFCGTLNIRIKYSESKIQNHLERLFALASYVGVGCKTGWGMGQCIVSKR